MNDDDHLNLHWHDQLSGCRSKIYSSSEEIDFQHNIDQSCTAN